MNKESPVRQSVPWNIMVTRFLPVLAVFCLAMAVHAQTNAPEPVILSGRDVTGVSNDGRFSVSVGGEPLGLTLSDSLLGCSTILPLQAFGTAGDTKFLSGGSVVAVSTGGSGLRDWKYLTAFGTLDGKRKWQTSIDGDFFVSDSGATDGFLATGLRNAGILMVYDADGYLQIRIKVFQKLSWAGIIDGRLIAAFGAVDWAKGDFRLRIFDLWERAVSEIGGFRDGDLFSASPVSPLVLSYGGNANKSQVLSLWNAETGKRIRDIVPSHGLSRAAFAHDGKTIVGIGGEGKSSFIETYALTGETLATGRIQTDAEWVRPIRLFLGSDGRVTVAMGRPAR